MTVAAVVTVEYGLSPSHLPPACGDSLERFAVLVFRLVKCRDYQGQIRFNFGL